MSIERSGGAYTPTCDYCGAELSPEWDFHDAVDAKKAAGWKSVKDRSEWFDYCPDCYKEMHNAASDFSEVGPCSP